MILFTFILIISPFIVHAAPQVKLGHTTLLGRDVTLLKQDFFGGIPFAEPPLGNLRLRPPVLKKTINGLTFDATHFGKACIQPESSAISADSMSEDCLTINVFRPSGSQSHALLPVLFWTYGGGFQAGASSIYNGSGIVARSVARDTPLIYVNFNYRLGPLGFPQGQEAGQRGALNLALRDQLAALEWVHHNIESFGGDKHKVTIFGESAGAIMSAILYLNSPLSSFARAAVFESGSAATSLLFNAEHRESDWQNFVAAVPECASLAKSKNTFKCLQNASSSTMLGAFLSAFAKSDVLFPFSPVLDGPNGLFPDFPSRLFERGHFARLPFIAGTNLDEGTLFLDPRINYTPEVIQQFLVANLTPSVVPSVVFNNGVRKLLDLYPDIPALGSPFNTGNETFGLSPSFKRVAALQGDISFQSQRRLWIQAAAKFGVKTFGYLFTEPQPTLPAFRGVQHGAEVVFVYGGIPGNSSRSALTVSTYMLDYWISFATSLDPNDGKGSQRPKWEQYTLKNKVVMQLNGDNTTVIPDTYRAKQIDFINSDPLAFRHRRSLGV